MKPLHVFSECGGVTGKKTRQFTPEGRKRGSLPILYRGRGDKEKHKLCALQLLEAQWGLHKRLSSKGRELSSLDAVTLLGKDVKSLDSLANLPRSSKTKIALFLQESLWGMPTSGKELSWTEN